MEYYSAGAEKPRKKHKASIEEGQENRNRKGNAPRGSRAFPRTTARSSSFHVKSPTTSRSEDLTRLLRTFEAEKLKEKEAAECHIASLKTRIHDLEDDTERLKQSERELQERLQELQSRNEFLVRKEEERENWYESVYLNLRVLQTSELERGEREKEQLSQTIAELQAITDRLTLENLRNEHQAKDQKELAEHRKKQHDQQVAAMEESIRALTERCTSTAIELKEKDKQLREKSRRLQENRSSHTTLENLRNEHQAKDQKELAEHRKKQHDQQVAAMEESIRALTERCTSTAIELKEKDKQLREKSRRLQEIEDRSSHTQPEALLEKILSEFQLRRVDEEKRREANEQFNSKIAKYHEQLVAWFPRMEEQRRRLEAEKDCAVSESEQLRREISQLREKICAECCICLASKPCVLFLPCRHMVICDSCHAESKISECPACRTRVGDSMKVFS
ncbi:hypothetical protein OESDEN_03336 [Oesophagostomum dentatum]|uniref:RING-type domain-containing protein n=1 Tax=Oesophagostomum dentatum TaxID=61180 RepID=A0A0B1TKU1_OESDE|nr:hypothetical protein OESDEN_03336 [Oesophagostomum dentatum]